MMRLLLKKGAHVLLNQMGLSALHYAVLENKPKCISVLLGDKRAGVIDDGDLSALLFAVLTDREKCIDEYRSRFLLPS